MFSIFNIFSKSRTRELLEKISKLEKEISSLKEDAERKDSHNRKLIHEVQLLNQFTQVLNENIILHTTLDQFIEKIKKSYNIENIILYLTDTFRNELKFFNSSRIMHLSPEEHALMTNKVIPLDKRGGLIYQTLMIRQQCYLDTVKPEHLFSEDKNLVELLRIQSLLLLPVIIQDNPAGVLLFFNHTTNMKLKNEDVLSIIRITDYITLVVQISNLTRESEYLHEISQRANPDSLPVQK